MKNSCRSILCAGIMGVALAAPTFAADICYSSAELQAEQVLRLDSELMVTTLTCRQSSRGRDLVPAYTAFTRRNLQLLRDAEKTLIRYYGASYGDSGISHLDTLRTALGNEASQQVADVSAPVFCERNRDKVMAFRRSSSAEVQDEVERMVREGKSRGRLCGSGDD